MIVSLIPKLVHNDLSFCEQLHPCTQSVYLHTISCNIGFPTGQEQWGICHPQLLSSTFKNSGEGGKCPHNDTLEEFLLCGLQHRYMVKFLEHLPQVTSHPPRTSLSPGTPPNKSPSIFPGSACCCQCPDSPQPYNPGLRSNFAIAVCVPCTRLHFTIAGDLGKDS